MYVNEDSFAQTSMFVTIYSYKKSTCRYRHVIKEQIYSTFHYLIQIVSLRIKKKKKNRQTFQKCHIKQELFRIHMQIKQVHLRERSYITKWECISKLLKMQEILFSANIIMIQWNYFRKEACRKKNRDAAFLRLCFSSGFP